MASRRPASGSECGERLRSDLQPLDVALGRGAEQPCIFAAELRRTLIAHREPRRPGTHAGEARFGRIDTLINNAIARAIRFALEQPDGVDINEVIVRPTEANM